MSDKMSVGQIYRTESPATLERGTLLSSLEAGLEPVILVFSLWGTAIYIKGMLPVADLMLSLLLFAITFPGAARLSKSVRQMIGEVLLHWMWVVLLLGLAAYATGYFYEFSPKIISVWLLILPTLLVLGHLLLRWLAPLLVRLQGPPRRAVVVGMNEQGVALASKITNTPYSRIEVMGFFDDRTLDRLDASMDYRLIAPLEELPEYVRNKGVNLIYLSIPMASQPRILQVLDNLKDTTASIFFVPDMFVTDLIQGRSGLVCGMPVISVCETPFTGWSGVIKRISDIVLSIIILMLK